MSLYRVDNLPACYALLRTSDSFGFSELDLVAPPNRFFRGLQQQPTPVVQGQDANRTISRPTPTSLLQQLPASERAITVTRRTLAALSAWFLICEDRQSRLECRQVETLAHQASLAKFILESPHLTRVLIGDEVGLGKTVEAGLVIQELLQRQPRLRVLYLTQARLVANVRRELLRLDMDFRQYSSDKNDCNLGDQLVVGSINRAAHEANYGAWLNAPAWDVLIADECHHLSNYGPEGSSPRRQYALVRDIIDRMPVDGRILLMSGTPHQGHDLRFENLLRLLCRGGEPVGAAAGRVIFRTKEDVRDWDGNPLFPQREVHPPRIFQGGLAYDRWLKDIHRLYAPDPLKSSSLQQRVAGWRSAQALQWAASSVQAGLGYLVRQAMRVGWTLDRDALREAMLVIRPYRLGPADETAESIFARIFAAIRDSIITEDDEDSEDEDVWRPDPMALDSLLRNGVALLHEVGDRKWDFIAAEILDRSPDDQFVLFAQPIETVTAFTNYLRRRYGTDPAVIIGGQEPAERERLVESFWQGKSRFLVSSRAGYEGFNLQCAHRLVHIDVPWNPMDLEQRVGRVHRFGSRETIVVDTVIMEGSREGDMYAVAYRRLEQIAGTLATDQSRMQLLFSRVMNLLPPEELVAVLASRAVGTLSQEERLRVSQMVEAGFQTWQGYHNQFSTQQRQIRALNPGEATWLDLFEFATTFGSATPAIGFSANGFRFDSQGVVRQVTDSVPACHIADGSQQVTLAFADIAGRHVFDAAGSKAQQAGLNLGPIASAIRAAAFPDLPAGAAWVRQPADGVLAEWQGPFALLVVARLSVITHRETGWAEHGNELLGFRINGQDEPQPLPSAQLAAVIRALRQAPARMDSDPQPELTQAIMAAEKQMIATLRRPTPEAFQQGIRHAVFPIAAVVVSR